jgi:hypothetical protein
METAVRRHWPSRHYDRAAFAALLVLTAPIMFLQAELFSVDFYTKGLGHLQKDRSLDS